MIFIQEECENDDVLKEEVEGLLQATELPEAEDFLEVPPTAIFESENAGLRRDQSDSVLECPGDMIGKYKLLQVIGEGGFGVVFMAEQMADRHRKVALKVIKPGMDTKEVVARFEAERQALAMMNHTNIAKVLDGVLGGLQVSPAGSDCHSEDETGADGSDDKVAPYDAKKEKLSPDDSGDSDWRRRESNPRPVIPPLKPLRA